MLILNIGLESRSDDKYPKDRTLRESMCLACIYREFIHIGKVALQHSNTEPTVVVTIEQDKLEYDHLTLCDIFRQDAIAIYNTHSRVGYIKGPRKGSMAFLREFFVLPCGRRLADVPYL